MRPTIKESTSIFDTKFKLFSLVKENAYCSTLIGFVLDILQLEHKVVYLVKFIHTTDDRVEWKYEDDLAPVPDNEVKPGKCPVCATTPQFFGDGRIRCKTCGLMIDSRSIVHMQESVSRWNSRWMKGYLEFFRFSGKWDAMIKWHGDKIVDCLSDYVLGIKQRKVEE